MPFTVSSSNHTNQNDRLFLIILAFSLYVNNCDILTFEQKTKLFGLYLFHECFMIVSKNYVFTLPPFLYPPSPFLLSTLPSMKHDASGSKTMDAGSAAGREREKETERETTRALSW